MSAGNSNRPRKRLFPRMESSDVSVGNRSMQQTGSMVGPVLLGHMHPLEKRDRRHISDRTRKSRHRWPGREYIKEMDQSGSRSWWLVGRAARYVRWSRSAVVMRCRSQPAEAGMMCTHIPLRRASGPGWHRRHSTLFGGFDQVHEGMGMGLGMAKLWVATSERDGIVWRELGG